MTSITAVCRGIPFTITPKYNTISETKLSYLQLRAFVKARKNQNKDTMKKKILVIVDPSKLGHSFNEG